MPSIHAKCYKTDVIRGRRVTCSKSARHQNPEHYDVNSDVRWTPEQAAREPYLTPTQKAAYDQIVAKGGTEHMGNGISRATLRVLEREGLVTVEYEIDAESNHRTGRNHSLLGWTAKLVQS
jgi:hypothetical protein